MDIFGTDTLADGIDVEEADISLEEFDHLFGDRIMAHSEDH
jgi:hypothetical protein